MEEELNNRLKIGVNVGGEEFGVHVENAAEGGACKTEREEKVFEGNEGGERSGAEIRVLIKGFVRVDVEGLKVDEFLAEENAGRCWLLRDFG